MRTILFPNGINDKSDIKFEAYDMRERYTSTQTLLGTASTTVAEVKQSNRMRLKLDSPNPDGRTAGFVTLISWMFDSKIPASTDSTPVHRPHARAVVVESETVKSAATSIVQKTHKRSHSLPSAIQHKAKTPSHGSLNLLFSNPCLKTFRFHSGKSYR